MIVISSREFRAKQKDYLDQIDSGKEIIIHRGKNKSYKIVPVKEDETLLTESDFLAKIERAFEQVKEGKITSVKTKEELTNFLNTL